MLNGLVHTMPWQCQFALSLSLSLCFYAVISAAKKDYSQYSLIPCLRLQQFCFSGEIYIKFFKTSFYKTSDVPGMGEIEILGISALLN
jgi:hypothetical protein